MFSLSDVKMIDKNYFTIIETSGFSVTLRSKNTELEWHIIISEYHCRRSFVLYHKHKGGTYHFQKSFGSFHALLKDIISHDAFHLKREFKKQMKREKAKRRIENQEIVR